MRRRRDRGGFTLLEVVLALALTTVVLYAVFLAVDLQLRTLDTGRQHVALVDARRQRHALQLGDHLSRAVDAAKATASNAAELLGAGAGVQGRCEGGASAGGTRPHDRKRMIRVPVRSRAGSGRAMPRRRNSTASTTPSARPSRRSPRWARFTSPTPVTGR